ncbi:hypothetical protein ANABIO32_11650 [Rossellomorea marisflavi]|uniref:hypothetical protein n=1 Tax=Rossellomorea marisflavi TaxID=189381 RepID=UPI0025C9BF1E|nr:hypothetical protein [Rossellomorea marisflavi]GLI83472.1 hypothetical protein ANABIO32_11650 [Rossellomorea marisflavi]
MDKSKIKIELSLKALIALPILGLIVGVLILNSVWVLNDLNAKNISYAGDLVGAIGNLIGAIIGGIVAYIIAAYQVQKTFEIERSKKNQENNATLRLLKLELSKNEKLLKGMKDDYLNPRKTDEMVFIDFISLEHWENCASKIGIEVSEETLSQFMSVYRKLRLVKIKELTLDEAQYNELIDEINKITSKLK